VDLTWRLLEFGKAGGWVMVPVAITSLLMWTLIGERLLTFRRLGRRDMGVQEAVHAVQGAPTNHFGHGLRATLVRNFVRSRTGDVALDRRILRECAMRMQPAIERNLAVIAVLGSIAPLLGLLGTVSGMITTFTVIATLGTGNARPLAGGISEALVATEAGLLVAIPGLLMSVALSRRAQRLTHQLDQTTLLLQHQLS
jgi:biopolymer transport protein ExbB